MILLIIPYRVHDVPHSKYRGSICFIYSVGPGFTSSRHNIRSFPVGLEFSYSGVCSIFENFPQDQISRPKHSRLNPSVIRVRQAVLVGGYADCSLSHMSNSLVIDSAFPDSGAAIRMVGRPISVGMTASIS